MFMFWAHRVKSVLNPYCLMKQYKIDGSRFMYVPSLQEKRTLVIHIKVATIEQCISLSVKKKKNRVEKVSTFTARAKRVMHI